MNLNKKMNDYFKNNKNKFISFKLKNNKLKTKIRN